MLDEIEDFDIYLEIARSKIIVPVPFSRRQDIVPYNIVEKDPL